MCDFAKGQIIAAKKIFPNSLLNCCFFHFSQIIWIKFKFYGMAGKGKYEFNLTLLFNIQLLCFIKPDLVKYLYNKIKKKFDVKQFFIYFNRNWLKTKYPIKLWNYYDKLNNANDNELDRYILTNNINENINRYLNNSLSKSRASYEDFVKSLEEVEKQFAIKLENSSNNNAKSKIILFNIYKIKLKNIKDLDALSKDEINEIKTNYMNLGFEFVNCKDNNNENDIDLEHIAYYSDNNIYESSSSDENDMDL